MHKIRAHCFGHFLRGFDDKPVKKDTGGIPETSERTMEETLLLVSLEPDHRFPPFRSLLHKTTYLFIIKIIHKMSRMFGAVV
jgi:hypothetical protein